MQITLESPRDIPAILQTGATYTYGSKSFTVLEHESAQYFECYQAHAQPYMTPANRFTHNYHALYSFLSGRPATLHSEGAVHRTCELSTKFCRGVACSN